MATPLDEISFREICEASPVGCAVLTASGEIIFANSCFNERLGTIDNICENLSYNDRLRLEAMLASVVSGAQKHQQKYAIPLTAKTTQDKLT